MLAGGAQPVTSSADSRQSVKDGLDEFQATGCQRGTHGMHCVKCDGECKHCAGQSRCIASQGVLPVTLFARFFTNVPAPQPLPRTTTLVRGSRLPSVVMSYSVARL